MSRLSEATKKQMHDHAVEVIEVQTENREREAKGISPDTTRICNLYDISDWMFSADRVKSLLDELTEVYAQLTAHKEAQQSKQKLVRDLDVLLNGDNAARQTSLCDIVAQVKSEDIRSIHHSSAEPETDDRAMLKRLAVILSGSDTPGEIRSLTVTAQSFVDRCKMLAEGKPYPEKLPCPVRLEPGILLGKGVHTITLLGALQRRAEYYAELEEMTPEEREEHERKIKAFKNGLETGNAFAAFDDLNLEELQRRYPPKPKTEQQ